MKIPVLSTSSASRIIILVSFYWLYCPDLELMCFEVGEGIGKRAVVGSGQHGVLESYGLFFLSSVRCREINSSLPYAICTADALMGITLAVAGAGFLLPKRLLVLLPVVLIVLAGADSYRLQRNGCLLMKKICIPHPPRYHKDTGINRRRTWQGIRNIGRSRFRFRYSAYRRVRCGISGAVR